VSSVFEKLNGFVENWIREWEQRLVGEFNSLGQEFKSVVEIGALTEEDLRIINQKLENIRHIVYQLYALSIFELRKKKYMLKAMVVGNFEEEAVVEDTKEQIRKIEEEARKNWEIGMKRIKEMVEKDLVSEDLWSGISLTEKARHTLGSLKNLKEIIEQLEIEAKKLS